MGARNLSGARPNQPVRNSALRHPGWMAATSGIIYRRRDVPQRHSLGPRKRDRADELEPLGGPLGVTAESDGHERIDGAERVIRYHEAEILQRRAIRIVAATDGAAKLGILQPRVGPRPAVFGSHRSATVERFGKRVLR